MSKTSVLGAGVLVLAILAVALVQTLRHSPTVSGLVTSAPHVSDEAAEDVPIGPTFPQDRRSEAPAGPESHDRPLTVLVIDEAGGPVQEARVFASLGDYETRRLGVTSTAGAVVCPELEAPFTLVASGDDIQTREKLVERTAPLVRMIVRRGARLSGKVVCTGSERTAPPNTRVVAWPSSWRVPPRELARRVQSADPRALATTVDGEGSFELSGLAPSTPYAVLAVTPGWCVWPPVVLEASENNILHMECVLGVRATVLELGGLPLGLPPLRSYGRRVPIEHLEMRGARYVPRPNPIAELFGFGEGPESGDPTRMELLFTCPEELAMLGPIAFDVDIPSYRRESVDLWALPTDHGIAEQIVEALPSGEARRELRLELEGVPSQASTRLAVRGKLGQIVLVDSEEHRRFLDLCDLSSRTISLPGLPRSLRFEGVHLTAENPTSVPCELASVTEDVESWRVDLSAFQTITVELRQPDDSQYLGPAIFLAGPSEDQLGGPIIFERSPFVLLSKRAPELCVLVFEPESFLIEAEVTPLEQPGVLRKASIGWH